MINALDVIEDRRQGKTCREIAEMYGIPEHQVWRLSQQHGIAGKYRGKQRSRARSVPDRRIPNLTTHDLLLLAFGEADEVIIERGCNGGYLVTIGDHTGDEQRDLQSAVRAAMRQ